MDNEVWKETPYKGYSASSWGRLRGRHGRILHGTPHGNSGYLRVGIPIKGAGGASKLMYYHVLIALAFHGPKPFEKSQVRHLDGNNSNNRPSNLAWGTSKQNHEDRKEHGTWPTGVKNGNAVLDDDKVRSIRAAYTRGNVTQQEIADQYGVDRTLISMVVTGKVWSHVD